MGFIFICIFWPLSLVGIMYFLKALGIEAEIVVFPVSFFGSVFLMNYIREKLRDRFDWDWAKHSSER